MKLLDQVRHVIRKKHYSIRTEQAYTNWIRKFILFNGKRHPNDMGERDFAIHIIPCSKEKYCRKYPESSAQHCCFSL